MKKGDRVQVREPLGVGGHYWASGYVVESADDRTATLRVVRGIFAGSVTRWRLEDVRPMVALPPGTRVLIDSFFPATVREAFPDGTETFMYPHYRVDYEDETRGRDVVASWNRISPA